ELAMLVGHERADGRTAGALAGQSLRLALVLVEGEQGRSIGRRVLGAHAKPSGFSGNCCLGSYQGAASDRQMWIWGLSVTRVSRQPRRSSRTGGGMRWARMGEPQREQKRRNLPGEDSMAPSCCSPRSQRNFSRGTAVTEEKAVPWVLRQVRQWQCTMRSRGAS